MYWLLLSGLLQNSWQSLHNLHIDKYKESATGIRLSKAAHEEKVLISLLFRTNA